MKTRYIFLLIAVLFFRETCPAQRKAALVIGNASYADVPLRNPANDATDMAATLRELGFTVTLKTNLNKQGMETAVGSFTAGLAPGDIALFFYSGHGMQVSGSNYLIPVNEAIGNETDVRYKAMDAQYVMDYMQDARTSVNIIILDACRDNPYRGYKSQTKGFIAVSAPQGTFIAYSTGPGKIAADGTGRNSPYTRNLISCMKMPDIEIEDAFKEVRKKVMSETGNQQVPWESTSLVQAFAFKGMATKPGPVPTGPIKENSGTTVTDIDGNVYHTVKIGAQTWMVENLRTTRYNDGTAIPLVTGNTAWGSLTTPGYCWYNNDIANKTPYGALYNWYAVNTGKLCPTGWHVATDAEWTQLTDYLGGENVAGGKMKEAGLSHWQSPNTGATNSSGFTALPGGYRSTDGSFYLLAYYAYFWSSSQYDETYAWHRYLFCYYEYVFSYYDLKSLGFSCRCLQD